MKKRCWIVVNGKLCLQPKFARHIDFFKASFGAVGIEAEIKKNDELINEAGEDCFWKNPPDFVLFWDKDIRLAYTLEKYFPLFNSAYCIEVCDDKMLSHHHLALSRVGTPRTIFAPKYFGAEDMPPQKFVDEVIHRLGLPLVVKRAFGSFGEGVWLAESKQDIFQIIAKIGGDKPYLFQEFIASSRGCDLRIYVAGGEVVGGVVRENKSDFRAGASMGGMMTEVRLSDIERQIALRAADAVGATFCGVDVLLDNKGLPLICEVNSNAHFINFFEATGIDFSKVIAKKIKRLLL